MINRDRRDFLNSQSTAWSLILGPVQLTQPMSCDDLQGRESIPVVSSTREPHG